MNKVGLIKNIQGFKNWSSASVCQDDGQYFIVSNSESINLTDYLANVSFKQHSKTSIPRTLARTALGGIAGLYWAKGRTGISGAAVGLGSSINTESETLQITLQFIDGDFIQGQTDQKTATLLENICHQSSGEDRIKKLQEEEKYSRFLDDASRTYYEVKDELSSLEDELKELDDIKNNGSNFKERDHARQKYTQLQEIISDKKSLLNELEFRAKAEKAFGYFETFNEQQAPLNLQIISLRNTLYDVKFFKKWHFYVLLISSIGFLAGVSSQDDADMTILYSSIILLFMIYYSTRFIFRFLMKSSRQNKLIKLQSEYDEKYGLNNITL